MPEAKAQVSSFHTAATPFHFKLNEPLEAIFVLFRVKIVYRV
jgi:hypothetical protein